MSLPLKYSDSLLEAGIDESGRGCLAGPVVAAAVILPDGYSHPYLTDSKALSHKQRMVLRKEILEVAISWNIGMISAQRIDQVNILNATYEAMHEAVSGLSVVPEFLLVDGNRFRTYPNIPNECIVKGDAKFLNIASASILAKTYRDEIMTMLDEKYPDYGWARNKGYPTKAHKMAIQEIGPTSFHRTSFNWKLPVNLF